MIDNPKASNVKSGYSHIRLVDPNPTFYTHPMHPSSFADDVYVPDLMEELIENVDNYKINKREPDSENVVLPHLSNEVRMILDHYCAMLEPNSPSTQTILTCCVMLGLRVLESNFNVKELVLMFKEFNRHGKGGDTLETYTHCFYSISPTASQESGARFNLPISRQCRGRIEILKKSTGLPYHMVAIMAAYACLCEQDRVPETYSEKWRAKLDGMFETIGMKVVLSKALNEELERSVWGRKR